MPSRRSPPAGSPVPSPVSDRDIAESGAGWFEEASDHVVARPEHGSIQLGPVTPVPGSDLVPGVLGWRRPITNGRAGAATSSTIYYLIGGRAGTTRGPSPLRGIDWSEFAAVVPLDRPSPGYVLGRGPAGQTAALGKLATAVAGELSNLDD